MSKRTITARDTQPDEYVEELRRDKELVERGLVRVTESARLDAAGALTHVAVVFSAIIEGRVVRLRVFCGSLWGGGADEDVQERASELVRKREPQLIDAGLEIRAGGWEQQ